MLGRMEKTDMTTYRQVDAVETAPDMPPLTSEARESSPSSFPIGNGQDANGSLRPKSTFINTSNRPRHAKKGPPWECGHSVLFATPHPYRDVPRLRPRYDPVPQWLYRTEEFLDEEASAVVLVYPPDVEAVTNLLLPVIGFSGPYLVLPVYGNAVTGTYDREVMVIARRPVPPPSVEHFRLSKYAMQRPADVAAILQPGATRALRIFMPDDDLLYDSYPHPRVCFGAPPPPHSLGGWTSVSPSCWRPWDE